MVDTGFVEVGAPGLTTMPVAVRRLGLSVILASAADSHWVASARSDRTPLADAIRVGERIRFGGLKFSVPLASDADLRHEWLVFRLDGVSVTRGSLAVETFICSPTNVVRDASEVPRAIALERAYLRAC